LDSPKDGVKAETADEDIKKRDRREKFIRSWTFGLAIIVVLIAVFFLCHFGVYKPAVYLDPGT
jgi:hypothetical protein